MLTTSKPRPMATPMWVGSKVTNRIGRGSRSAAAKWIASLSRTGWVRRARREVEASLIDGHHVEVVPCAGESRPRDRAAGIGRRRGGRSQAAPRSAPSPTPPTPDRRRARRASRCAGGRRRRPRAARRCRAGPSRARLTRRHPSSSLSARCPGTGRDGIGCDEQRAGDHPRSSRRTWSMRTPAHTETGSGRATRWCGGGDDGAGTEESSRSGRRRRAGRAERRGGRSR